MDISIGELAQKLGLNAAGDLSMIVTMVRQPDEAGPKDLALAISDDFLDMVPKGAAQAALVTQGADWEKYGLKAVIFSERGRLTMASIAQIFDNRPAARLGIHCTAIIDETAQIGADCAISPYVVIGPNVCIGARARIEAHVTIDAGTIIGDDAFLMSGARIGHSVKIGDRFIAQMNAVVGSDGFSFVTPKYSSVEDFLINGTLDPVLTTENHQRINSLGSVVIGDDVELGVNTVVDRGTVSDTIIGNRVKTDNFVQFGHNVDIGDDTMVCSQSIIGGSTVVGKRVTLAGRSAVADHISVGDDSITLAGSGVFTRVPERTVVIGYPAVKYDTFIKMYKAQRRLPAMAVKLAALQKRVLKADETGDQDGGA